MVFPERVVFPDGFLSDRFNCIFAVNVNCCVCSDCFSQTCLDWPHDQLLLANQTYITCLHNGPPALTDQMFFFKRCSLKTVYTLWMSLNYHILPNKHACLNKRAPDLWLWLAISQTLLNPSESYCQHLNFGYAGVDIARFIEIREG